MLETKVKTHAWLAQALSAEGVEKVFGYIAEENQNLMVSLDAAGIGVIQTRHEQAATGMADGYARSTGGLAVCAVGHGPGVAQTGTSLVTMRKKGSSVLLLVPLPTPAQPFAAKRFRQTEFLASTIERVITVEAADDLEAALSRALAAARSGPVALQVPEQILDGETALPPYEPVSPTLPVPPRPEDEALEEILAALVGPERPPVILAGAGAVKAGARDELIRLAERTGSLLATSVQGNGFFHGHPRNLGVIGSVGTELAAEIITQAPAVLAVGASLNPYTTYGGGLLKDVKVYHVDLSRDRIGSMTEVHRGVVGDARVVAHTLNELADGLGLSAEQLPSSRRLWLEQIEARLASTPRLQEGETSHAPGRLDPRDVIRRLDQLLPEDRVVVTDAGHFMRWVLDGLAIRDPRDYFWTADFASIGQGTAIATGVAVSRPDRHCILVAGDGGFSMAIHELATLVHYRIPLTVIVWNDGTLGSEYHNLGVQGQPVDLAVIDNPDFSEVARAFGGRGLAVSTLDELDALPGLILKGEGLPIVVDVKIDPDVRHRSKR